jgi:hypothetical protein
MVAAFALAVAFVISSAVSEVSTVIEAISQALLNAAK